MGVDKATLEIHGETFAARAARVLADVCSPVIEVGSGVSGLPVVCEEPRGSGPLVALLAGADALRASGPVLLLACDLPFVEAPLLRLLAGWPGDGTVVPVSGERRQYVCARYGRATLVEAHTRLAHGDSSLRAVADADCEQLTEAQWQPVAPAHAFADVDTPEDFLRLGLA
jgi:molybdopterin-guanine dinucleotide biosynthesis protein A